MHYYLVLVLFNTFPYQPLCFTVLMLHFSSGAEGDSRSTHTTLPVIPRAARSCIFMRRFCSEAAGYYWCLAEEEVVASTRWRKKVLILVYQNAPAACATRVSMQRLLARHQRARGCARLPEGDGKSGLIWDLTRVSCNLGYILLAAIFWTEWMREWCLSVSGFPFCASL